MDIVNYKTKEPDPVRFFCFIRFPSYSKVTLMEVMVALPLVLPTVNFTLSEEPVQVPTPAVVEVGPE